MKRISAGLSTSVFYMDSTKVTMGQIISYITAINGNQIMLRDSQDAEALYLLSIIAYQSGRYEMTIDLITRAIEIDSNQAPFF